jgi:hypothetical protein
MRHGQFGLARPLAGPSTQLSARAVGTAIVRLEEHGWRRTGETSELVDHVCLIVEANRWRERCPRRDVRGEQSVHQSLKTSDPRKQLWRHSGSGMELTAELLTTQSVAPRHRIDADTAAAALDEPSCCVRNRLRAIPSSNTHHQLVAQRRDAAPGLEMQQRSVQPLTSFRVQRSSSGTIRSTRSDAGAPKTASVNGDGRPAPTARTVRPSRRVRI